MPDNMTTEDPDLLAAEYVLGTLDPDQRAQAHVLLGVDLGFVAMVRLWERRLGELHQMVEPVEPDKSLWERINKRVNAIQQNPIENHTLLDPPPKVPAAEPPVSIDIDSTALAQRQDVDAPKVAISKAADSPAVPMAAQPARRTGPWRALAIVMTLAVLLLGSLNVAWFYFPELLPELLRPPFELTSSNLQEPAPEPTSKPAKPPVPPGPPFEE